MAEDLRLTDTQRKILEALCRPCTGETHFAPPATNQEIADELFLSVDAIKAHLRVLYRKFGIEPLPHNQKRARLVELALEGGVVPNEGTAIEAAGSTAVAVLADSEVAAEAPPQTPRAVPRVRNSSRLIAAGVAVGALIVAVIAVVLITGGDGGSDPATSRSAYTAAVTRFCDQAVNPPRDFSLPTRVTRAVAYGQTFSLVRDQVESEPTPSEDDQRLTQFITGLGNAADFNSQVARTSAAEAPKGLPSINANLIIAAGNIQAGAIGYKLGGSCAELGNLVSDSAQNAAGPP